MDRVTGELRQDQRVSGEVAAAGFVSGAVFPGRAVRGEITQGGAVTGDVAEAAQVRGEVWTGDGPRYPPYSGPYTVTPGDAPTVLPTEGTVLTADLLVRAIPENYGKITWNGSYLTVS